MMLRKLQPAQAAAAAEARQVFGPALSSGAGWLVNLPVLSLNLPNELFYSDAELA